LPDPRLVVRVGQLDDEAVHRVTPAIDAKVPLDLPTDICRVVWNISQSISSGIHPHDPNVSADRLLDMDHFNLLRDPINNVIDIIVLINNDESLEGTWGACCESLFEM
jgi:hypothetical protein